MKLTKYPVRLSPAFVAIGMLSALAGADTAPQEASTQEVNLEQDKIDADRRFAEGMRSSNLPPLVLLSDELECELDKQVTDSYGRPNPDGSPTRPVYRRVFKKDGSTQFERVMKGFDRSVCKYLKTGPLPKILAGNYAETLQCPDSSNLASVNALMAKLDAAVDQYDSTIAESGEKPVDIAPLIVAPLDPQLTDMEAQLPSLCGYNSGLELWFDKIQLLCKPNGDCTYSAKGDDVSGSLFRPVEGEENYRKKISGNGGKSYRDGGDVGDLRFIPLGNGVYVATVASTDTASYPRPEYAFKGLLVAPSQAAFQRRACEKSADLEKRRGNMQSDEISKVQASIRALFMRGEALTRLKALTRQIEQTKNQLPESEVEALKTQAKRLIEIVEGRKKQTKHWRWGPFEQYEKNSPQLPGYVPNPVRCPDGLILFEKP
jgi:hypothetical protein